MRSLGRTRSLCPYCLRIIDAEKVLLEDDIYLVKKCPEHGEFKVLIWRGYESYMKMLKFNTVKERPRPMTKTNKGCPLDCGPCPQHKQKTCVAILEVTSRCNLNCPICFANATGSGIYNPDLDTIREMYKVIIENAERPYVVQISGGEPTVRKDLPEIVAMGKEMGIDFIELNTNGVLLAKDLDLLRSLKDNGLDSLFFSFDGLTSDVYIKRCGADLLDLKLRVLENCRKVGLGVVLVPVIDKHINYHQIGDIINFAKKWVPTVVGVHFQPVAYFGRVHKYPENDDRVTLPDVLRAIEEQTEGELKEENFVPTACPNVHCEARCFSILDTKTNRLLPLTHESFGMSLKMREDVMDIAKKTRTCICELWKMPSTDSCKSKVAPGSWEEFVEIAKTKYLTVSIMPFQDAWTIEVERLMECCIHVVTPSRKLIPQCAFNVSSIDGHTLYRHKEFGV